MGREADSCLIHMTDLLHVLPDFETKSYTHLFPSLEKHLITTTDLLTLDALEIAKRAQLPLLDVRRLVNHVTASLQTELEFESSGKDLDTDARTKRVSEQRSLKRTGKTLVKPWKFITTLDPTIDAALAGGIPAGYLTEIVGESGAGKTQFLLSLLLASQLPEPRGLSRPAIYISTEAPLATSRLEHILTSNPTFQEYSRAPSLDRVLSVPTPDLESQEHIITFQLPLAIAKHNVGLVVIDSVAANYRAERSNPNAPAALAERSEQLSKLGSQLRNLAMQHDCAIVVANQVADRFDPVVSVSSVSGPKSTVTTSSPQEPLSSNPAQQFMGFNPLTLDHQMRFFSGWGSDPNASNSNLKTPSLGLVWANQIACRLVLIKKASYRTQTQSSVEQPPTQSAVADWNHLYTRRWLRIAYAPWVEATEDSGDGHEFEIWAGGIRSIKLKVESGSEPQNRPFPG